MVKNILADAVFFFARLAIKKKLTRSRVAMWLMPYISLFFLLLFFLVVPGNVSTCLVVMKNSYMRNQTYIYLTNLAITDILTLLVGK